MSAFGGIDVSRVLVAGMKTAQANHVLIANNIANIDTPNYNPTRLDFQATLQSEIQGSGHVGLRKTRPKHLDASVANPSFLRLALSSKNDYNKVDLDQEMADLAENTGKYTTYGSLLAKQFSAYRNMLSTLR
ncbi:MAG: hypothetical protein AMXMBFR84_07880 [Candidatus Hydrogenedentota bacterium]